MHSFVPFALSILRVSKLLELNPNDNQGVRFLLRDLDEGLSWEESMARDEARPELAEGSVRGCWRESDNGLSCISCHSPAC